MGKNIVLAVAPGFVGKKPLLGVAYLVAALRARGHEVSVADLNMEFRISLEESDGRLWDQTYVDSYLAKNPSLLDAMCTRLAGGPNKPDLVGFSVWYLNQPMTIALAERLKKDFDVPFVIIGGPQANDTFWQSEHFDAAVDGEGEAAITAIADALPDRDKRSYMPDRERLAYIPGVRVRFGKRDYCCGPALEVPNLDALPLPDFTGFPLQNYLQKHTLPVSFNRGCKNKCSFCGVEHYWKTFRTRSAEALYAEFQRNIAVYDAHHFAIDCPAFNLDMKAVNGLCDRIISDGLPVEWTGMGLISRELDVPTARRLVRAGCTRIDFGFESGSDRVLARMRKPFNTRMAEEVLRACSGAGIECSLSIILGFPGETEEDVEDTKRFLERNRAYFTDLGRPCECGVGGDSLLQLRPLEFGIKPESIQASLAWESTDGKLTHAVRLERLRKFNEWLRQSGFMAQNEPAQGLIADQKKHLSE